MNGVTRFSSELSQAMKSSLSETRLTLSESVIFSSLKLDFVYSQ